MALPGARSGRAEPVVRRTLTTTQITSAQKASIATDIATQASQLQWAPDHHIIACHLSFGALLIALIKRHRNPSADRGEDPDPEPITESRRLSGHAAGRQLGAMAWRSRLRVSTT